MDKTIQGVALTRAANSQKSLKEKLMLAASAGIITLAAPATGLYGSRAFAQEVVPAECDETDQTADSVIENNETLTCEGSVSDPIDSTVANLTVVIGSESTVGIVQQDTAKADHAISMDGENDQSLTITDGSAVLGEPNASTAVIRLQSLYGDVTIDNQGNINLGRYAIDATVGAGGENLSISSTTDLEGTVSAENNGEGVTQIDLTDITVTGNNNPALNVSAGETANTVNVNVGSIYTDADFGLSISNSGTHDTTLEASGMIEGYDVGAILIAEHENGSAVVVDGLDGLGAFNGNYIGLGIASDGADVTVKNLDSVNSNYGIGLGVLTNTGNITIDSIKNAQGGYYGGGSFGGALFDETAIAVGSASGDISIQNVSVLEPEFPADPEGRATRTANGIFVGSGDGDVYLGTETAIGDLLVDESGIRVYSDNGEVRIHTAGDINIGYGTDNYDGSGTGIFVNTNRTIDGAAQTTMIDAGGQIDAYRAGIEVSNEGFGATRITAHKQVTSSDDDAIGVESVSAASGDITIVAKGILNAGEDGIDVNHAGDAKISITAYKAVSANEDAIDIDSKGGIIDINVFGTVYSEEDEGIDVDQNGTGHVDKHGPLLTRNWG